MGASGATRLRAAGLPAWLRRWAVRMVAPLPAAAPIRALIAAMPTMAYQLGRRAARSTVASGAGCGGLYRGSLATLSVYLPGELRLAEARAQPGCKSANA